MSKNTLVLDSFDKGKFVAAPKNWKSPCANAECTMHQISPYIGKIKSTIAGELIREYSKKNDLVIDPFAGAGTIPLESVLQGRDALGADISPYAEVLSKAKLAPPNNLETAIAQTERILLEAQALPTPSLEFVPTWVKDFFHPNTLQDAVQFATIARLPGNEFVMGCFLGILHHQRPGFLSYPSSHLVPYLRNKKYPRIEFPEMYNYREIRHRLLAKVKRTYKRYQNPDKAKGEFIRSAVQNLSIPNDFGALITSPPYMNALDYGRDNRLRLWFIDPKISNFLENDLSQQRDEFVNAVKSLCVKIECGLRHKGFCIFVVGESLQYKAAAHPSQTVFTLIRKYAPSLNLKRIITDHIPDVRRTRRECRGVKTEHVLVFQKN